MAGLALEGLRVLDCTQILSGPYCSMLLADMGADVIKVERPDGGDDARRLGPPFLGDDAAIFHGLNRNKRGLAVDLRHPRGRELMLRLAERADILVENFRPGTMARLGLGYDALRARNPRLIYCSVSGFGQTGPYAARGGFDLVAQGMSGLMSITGLLDGTLVKVGVPITDLNAGMYACYGVLCALMARLRTGEGQLVDTSLLECGIAYTFWESGLYFATGQVPGPTGSAHRGSAPYQAFPTADGHIIVGGANQNSWVRLCQVLERPDLAADPRFADSAGRLTHRDELIPVLAEILRRDTTATWCSRLEAAGVPAGPVNNLAQVYADPQVQAREMAVELRHPVAGPVTNIGLPVKLSGTPGAIRRPAPTLGEHTDEVCGLAGCGDEEIAALRAEGVIR